MRCDWLCRDENMYNARSTGQRILNFPFARSNQYVRSYASFKYKLKSHLRDRASE